MQRTIVENSSWKRYVAGIHPGVAWSPVQNIKKFLHRRGRGAKWDICRRKQIERITSIADSPKREYTIEERLEKRNKESRSSHTMLHYNDSQSNFSFSERLSSSFVAASSSPPTRMWLFSPCSLPRNSQVNARRTDGNSGRWAYNASISTQVFGRTQFSCPQRRTVSYHESDTWPRTARI